VAAQWALLAPAVALSEAGSPAPQWVRWLWVLLQLPFWKPGLDSDPQALPAASLAGMRLAQVALPVWKLGLDFVLDRQAFEAAEVASCAACLAGLPVVGVAFCPVSPAGVVAFCPVALAAQLLPLCTESVAESVACPLQSLAAGPFGEWHHLVAGLLCGDAMGVCCHGPAHVLAVGQPEQA